MKKKFLFTRAFNAPIKAVWKAWTDAKQVAKWWGPHGFTVPVCKWNARPGHKIYVVMRGHGNEHPMGGEFVEVVPPKKLVMICGALDADGAMMFEFRHEVKLAGRNGKTKLTLKSQLTRTTKDAARYIGGFVPGMTQTLERLTMLVEPAAEPVVVEATVNAPTKRVWHALTAAEAIKKWSFGLKEFKPVVGFEFTLHAEKDGVQYVHLCKITDVIPNKKLVYTWRYEGHPGDSLVTWELVTLRGKTRVKLTHSGVETFPKTPDFARANFVQGWTHIVGASLKGFVEKTK